MKFLSALLILCIVFISLSGMVKRVAVSKNCCKEMTGKFNCNKNSQEQSKGCDKQACPMLLSCTICGFIKPESFYLQTYFENYTPKPVAVHIIGDLSAYHPSNWKPPKAC
jgi:hypothetical protein